LEFIPTRKYAAGSEILEFCRKLATKYALYEKTLLQTEVSAATWDDKQQLWLITTDRGDCLKARFLAIAAGFLHRPKLPSITGIHTFTGSAFHTSRWNFDYTGGDCLGNMDRLHDKRVGIIGTGTTSLQAVPKFFKTASKGWHQERIDNFGKITSGMPQDKILVHDGWVDLFLQSKELAKCSTMDSQKPPSPEEIAAAAELDDFLKMESMRKRIDDIVKDAATADQLKPWYGLWCKRPGFHDEYLHSFNRENVTLVDTQGKGVDQIEPDGIVVQKEKYPVDCIIFATGFEFSTDLEHRMGTKIQGQGGLDLMEHWKDGPRTLHGLMTSNFPNMFYVSNNQAGVGPNFTHLLVEQAKHMSYIVAQTINRSAKTVEVLPEAEEAWVQKIVNAPETKGRVQYLRNCTPGYLNNESRVDEKHTKGFSYPGGAVPFFSLCQNWRDEGSCSGLVFHTKTSKS
jgi:cyclohexanone monooxygenase